MKNKRTVQVVEPVVGGYVIVQGGSSSDQYQVNLTAENIGVFSFVDQTVRVERNGGMQTGRIVSFWGPAGSARQAAGHGPSSRKSTAGSLLPYE